MERTESRNIPWIIKYRPRTLKEVIGNKEGIRKVVKWLKSWEAGPPKKRALLIYGPPGIGKTVAVEAASRDLNLELIESNASDYRRNSDIKSFAGLASQYSTLTGRRRVILLDEIDGISGSIDKGGLKAILSVIENTRCPIVLTANEVFDPRFLPLRDRCLLIEFKRPSVREIVSHLRRICLLEGIDADERALRYIAEKSNGDVRSALNDLQAAAQGLTRLTMEDVLWLGYRNRKEDIFKVLRTIFYSKNCITVKQAVDRTNLDLDMLFEWIYENVPYHFDSPFELSEAMEALALADLYRKRIGRTQSWSLLRYVIDLMTAGVALSRVGRSGRWVPFRFPQRIKLLSSTKKSRELLSKIGSRIGEKCHVSSRVAVREILPYLRVIFQNDRKSAEGLARWLELDKTMIRYIVES